MRWPTSVLTPDDYTPVSFSGVRAAGGKLIWGLATRERLEADQTRRASRFEATREARIPRKRIPKITPKETAIGRWT